MQLRNYLLIIGTAIGAGIFALPAVVKTIGIFPFLFLLLFLAFVTGLINFMYYRVVGTVKDKHQLTGYAKLILGKRAGTVAAFIQVLGLSGAMIAFLALGSEYASQLFLLPKPAALLLFWTFIAVPFLFLGSKLELFDYLAVCVKLIIFTILCGVSIMLLQTSNVSFIEPLRMQSNIVAYGTILFSLASFSIVPEMKKTPGGIFKAIISAQFTMIFLYAVFAIGFSNIIGQGGKILVNGWMGRMLEGAGIIAVYTPFMLFAWVAFDLLTKDLHFNTSQSKALVMLVPLAVVLIGVAQFDLLVAITGGIFLSSAGIMIAELYKTRFPGKNHHLVLLLQGALLLGIVSVVIKLLM